MSFKCNDEGSSALIASKLPCSECGSSDAYAQYADGWGHCFSCKANTRWDKDITKVRDDSASMVGFPADDDAGDVKKKLRPLLKTGEIIGLEMRGIDEATCRKYGYEVGRDEKGIRCHIANEYDLNGRLVAQKLRYKDKTFSWTGDTKAIEPLYGMHLYSPSHNQNKSWETMVIVTEGEIDCLSVSMMLDNKRPVVSLSKGAGDAAKSISKAIEWLDRFDKVILLFDMDKPGRDAVEEAAARLPVGKAFIAKLPLKDANECLMKGMRKQVVEAIWSAEPWRPDRVLDGKDLVSEVMDYEEPEGIPWPWKAVRKFLPVIQCPSITLLIAGTGAGKTTLSRALEHYILTCGEKLGIMHLEEAPKKTALGLVGYEMKKKLNYGTKGIDKEELRNAASRILSDRVFLYDGFGSIALDVIVARIRYMAGAGCRYVFLDHLSILASGIDGDERKALDIAMTRLRTLCEELKIGLILVAHIKRGSNAAEGSEITDEDIRGSQGIAQLSDTIVTARRNKKAEGWKRNLVLLTCIKNREWGMEGEMCCLMYDDNGQFNERPVSDWQAEDIEDVTDALKVDEKDTFEASGEIPF